MPDWDDIKKWFEANNLGSEQKLLIFALGFLAANLTLAINVVTEQFAAMVFVTLVVILLITVLFFIRPNQLEKTKLLRSRTGIATIATLAYGVGVLIYHKRDWFIWGWYKFRKIDRPDEWVLFALFLIGVMLGFFIVRNWSQDQKTFVTSLTAVFGAAFVSTMLGQLNTQPGSVLVPTTTFSYYALGFTLSGVSNLVAFAFLAAHYTRTQSPTTRAIIDFLYGSEKAAAIDGYFLKNFEDDPNYARTKLIGALSAYREIIKYEFAKKMGRRKEKYEGMAAQNGASNPALCPPGTPVPPFDYFELLSVRTKAAPSTPPPTSAMDETYEVLFRRLKCGAEAITADMFRVAISMKWLDDLEYIVAPGQYQKRLPYAGSVAGLALGVKQTIVMDRDKYKKFRSAENKDGKTPSEADQPRGLHKIDYLSYVVLPMASSFGRQEETPLGVLHLDTSLFAYTKGALPEGSCREDPTDNPNKEIFKVERKGSELAEFAAYASNLYEEKDELIASLESMRGVIVPLLELYQKCKTGGRQPTQS